MKYRALRTVTGDYGTKHAGEIFEVPDFMVKRLAPLESKGVIMRQIPRPVFDRKAYVAYENKSVQPLANKAGVK